MEATAVHPSSQSRFPSWNISSTSSDFHTTLNKLNINLNHPTAAITKGTGYDMVSMEMEDTPTGGGGGGGGAGDLYALGLHHGHSAHSTRAAAMVPHHHAMVPTPIQMLGMPHYMHHTMGKQLATRKYPCKMCSQMFESKTEYQMHVQSHMREPKPYKCSQCTKSFANSSYLSQHMRIHLGIKPYHCDICKKKFTQLSHLQQHLRTHTGDKPYKCHQPGCHKAFSQLSNLQSHSRCHQTDKPHKCNSCYKCFYDEISLQGHIPKHKDSKHLKTHICNYCGKSYTQETYLARHMAKHSDKMGMALAMGASLGQHDKQRCAAAAVHALAQAQAQAQAAAKNAEDYYFTKQEPNMDSHNGPVSRHAAISSDDLYLQSYSPYVHPHYTPYGAPHPTTSYDMLSAQTNSPAKPSSNMAASVFSLTNSGRSMYYSDGINAIKSHNAEQDKMEEWNRGFAAFGGMPTMLTNGSSKEMVKQPRY